MFPLDSVLVKTAPPKTNILLRPESTETETKTRLRHLPANLKEDASLFNTNQHTAGGPLQLYSYIYQEGNVFEPVVLSFSVSNITLKATDEFKRNFFRKRLTWN